MSAAGALQEPNTHIDPRGDTLQSSLESSGNDHHDKLQDGDFTFYMSQISVSEYIAQKSTLWPQLEELIAGFEPHGDSRDVERAQLFVEANLSPQDFGSAILSIQHVFKYVSLIAIDADRTSQTHQLALLIECLADASRIGMRGHVSCGDDLDAEDIQIPGDCR